MLCKPHKHAHQEVLQRNHKHLKFFKVDQICGEPGGQSFSSYLALLYVLLKHAK